MYFIGIILENQKFDILKNFYKENMNKNSISLININKSNIKNLRNIKFDAIVICEPLYKFNNEVEELKKICKQCNNLIINSDITIGTEALQEYKFNIITFGLNHKSSVTLSSITDENVLISVQRNFCNIEKELIDVGEYNIKIDKKDRSNIQEILIIFIINFLYNKKIIAQI